MTEEFPFLQCGEIQEPEVDRLFDFVDQLTRYKDDGDVCLYNVNRSRIVGIDTGIGESFYKSVKIVAHVYALFPRQAVHMPPGRHAPVICE